MAHTVCAIQIFVGPLQMYTTPFFIWIDADYYKKLEITCLYYIKFKVCSVFYFAILFIFVKRIYK